MIGGGGNVLWEWLTPPPPPLNQNASPIAASQGQNRGCATCATAGGIAAGGAGAAAAGAGGAAACAGVLAAFSGDVAGDAAGADETAGGTGARSLLAATPDATGARLPLYAIRGRNLRTIERLPHAAGT